MASIEVLTERFATYDIMYSQDLRVQSFADWPFREECNCTPEKALHGRTSLFIVISHNVLPLQMAKAGFVHCPSQNEPDVACCFFCLIELEGWEPDDDPWTEHAKRSPNCGFLSMKETFNELTVSAFFNLEKERLKVFIRKICHKKMAQMRDDMLHVVEGLKSQLESL
ncbi:baculoviral IAP repeat-containing protein 5b isoform X2 [Oryzias melastigma]|uniref:Baculoviral IAP repeat containing 5b n=1 Tax=Oryzias melastigma TaxID=30732 RepID=A0A3B3DQM4_ORYME|nr:baculoviral IAP repeat-containing protein 5b isoform X2 [Oryzias melastigma]